MWTKENLAQIEAAILELSSGKAKVKVRLDLGGSSREVEYQRASLDQLRRLRGQMISELNSRRTINVSANY